MGFQHLDEGQGLDYAATLAFKITDDWNETWTARFGRFKAKDSQAAYGSASLLKAVFPDLVAQLGIKPENTVLIPALSSSEKVADRKRAIPVLAKGLSQQCGMGYDDTAVSKDPHVPIHGVKGAAARLAVLNAANYTATPVKAEVALVVDDFITQGATLGITAQRLKAATPGLCVIGVALGKNERLAWGASNAHIPPAWDDLWNKGEQAYLQKQMKGP
jgi:hypothetical protein